MPKSYRIFFKKAHADYPVDIITLAAEFQQQVGANLYTFLTQYKDEGASCRILWEAHTNYSLPDGSLYYFDINILKRDGKKGSRYEVFSMDNSSMVGKGGYGGVYKVLATFKLDQMNNNIVYMPAKYFRPHKLSENKVFKQRVIKVQHNLSTQKKEEARDEDKINTLATHLLVKPMLVEWVSDTFFTVMRKLPGKELYRLVLNGTISRLSDTRKITLGLALLKALDQQVHGANIIHKDLKLENIMVKIQRGAFIVNIYDFGLSTCTNQPDNRNLGNPLFRAPERLVKRWHLLQIESKDYPATDVFAMGMILAIIVAPDAEKKLSEFHDTKEVLFKHNRNASNKVECKAHPEIEQIIKDMLAVDIRQRLALKVAIKRFEAYLSAANSEKKTNQDIMLSGQDKPAVNMEIFPAVNNNHNTACRFDDNSTDVEWVNKMEPM